MTITDISETLDFSWLSTAKWPTALVAIAVLVLSFLSMFKSRKHDKDLADREKREAYQAAEREYLAAIESRSPERIMQARQRLDDMIEQGWHLICLAGMAAYLCVNLVGCKSQPKTVYIPVGEHVIFPEPGYVVKELPAGERTWVLMTHPTGTKLMLPQSNPLSNAQQNN